MADWGPARETGTPILLLHGLGGNTHWWDPVVPFLKKHHHVAALDFRGHGDSAWADPPRYFVDDYLSDIEAAREALGWERFILVGHSFGARMALEYAARDLRRLKRLAVLDFLADIEHKDPGRFALGKRVRQPIYRDPELMVRRFHLQPEGSSADAGLLKDLARQSLRDLGGGRWTWKFDWRAFDLDYEPVWGILPRIDLPCLVIRGEFSTVMHAEEFERVVARLPQGRGVQIAGAHHHVTLDKPEEVARALLDFLSA